MKLLNFIKYTIGIVAIVYVFVDWKVSLLLFAVGGIINVIPSGPNALLSVVAGYLLFYGVVYVFIDWKRGVASLFLAYATTKFRMRGNRLSEESRDTSLK
jgi:hypothetical protein